MTDDARLDWEARIDRRREGGTAPTPILDPTLRRLGYPAARLLWTELGGPLPRAASAEPARRRRVAGDP